MSFRNILDSAGKIQNLYLPATVYPSAPISIINIPGLTAGTTGTNIVAFYPAESGQYLINVQIGIPTGTIANQVDKLGAIQWFLIDTQGATVDNSIGTVAGASIAVGPSNMAVIPNVSDIPESPSYYNFQQVVQLNGDEGGYYFKVFAYAGNPTTSGTWNVQFSGSYLRL
jgi:hypothetical protein